MQEAAERLRHIRSRLRQIYCPQYAHAVPKRFHPRYANQFYAFQITNREKQTEYRIFRATPFHCPRRSDCIAQVRIAEATKLKYALAAFRTTRFCTALRHNRKKFFHKENRAADKKYWEDSRASFPRASNNAIGAC